MHGICTVHVFSDDVSHSVIIWYLTPHGWPPGLLSHEVLKTEYWSGVFLTHRDLPDPWTDGLCVQVYSYIWATGELYVAHKMLMYCLYQLKQSYTDTARMKNAKDSGCSQLNILQAMAGWGREDAWPHEFPDSGWKYSSRLRNYGRPCQYGSQSVRSRVKMEAFILLFQYGVPLWAEAPWAGGKVC